MTRPALFRKYEVNLLIDCSTDECARVVFESNPTPQHLFGSIEKEAYLGALTTDFTMIRAGSLHRANGGYLVLDFDDLLHVPALLERAKANPAYRPDHDRGARATAWASSKRSTVRPEPIPWTGKIVGVTRESVYRILYTVDPDFRELFKVKANFDMRIDRTPEHERSTPGLIAAVTSERRPAAPGPGGRGARDRAGHAAGGGPQQAVDPVRRDRGRRPRGRALGRRDGRERNCRRATSSRSIRERKRATSISSRRTCERQSEKQIIVVDTAGEAMGQVNGLSVIDLGDTSFGQPSRITATVGVGREGVARLAARGSD